MKVKVLCLGRSAKEINVSDGTTVEQAIAEAGFPKDSSYTRHLNGSPCFDTDVVVEGSVLDAGATSERRGLVGRILRCLPIKGGLCPYGHGPLFPPEER
jgi:hypothetical protein